MHVECYARPVRHVDMLVVLSDEAYRSVNKLPCDATATSDTPKYAELKQGLQCKYTDGNIHCEIMAYMKYVNESISDGQ